MFAPLQAVIGNVKDGRVIELSHLLEFGDDVPDIVVHDINVRSCRRRKSSLPAIVLATSMGCWKWSSACWKHLPH